MWSPAGHTSTLHRAKVTGAARSGPVVGRGVLDVNGVPVGAAITECGAGEGMHSGLVVIYLNERENVSVEISTVEASAAIARRNKRGLCADRHRTAQMNERSTWSAIDAPQYVTRVPQPPRGAGQPGITAPTSPSLAGRGNTSR